jgi:hypothetical protein
MSRSSFEYKQRITSIAIVHCSMNIRVISEELKGVYRHIQHFQN